MSVSFCIQTVKGVLCHGEESVGIGEACDPRSRPKTVVGGVCSVRDCEEPFPFDLDKIGHVIAIGVGVVEETLVEEQLPGIKARSPAVPSEGAFPRCHLDRLHGSFDLILLFLTAHIILRDPAVPMAADLVALSCYLLSGHEIPLQGQPGTEEGDLYVISGKVFHKAPEAASRAVFKQRLDLQVSAFALAYRSLGHR